MLARSSQPLVGVLGWRNGEDEKLLQAISLSCTPVTDHTPFDELSSPVPIPYRNGGPTAQMMEDRGLMAQSVCMNNGNKQRNENLRVVAMFFLFYRSRE